jgi:hypothetical protein
MATIKTCDWTKKRLAKDEETFTLILNGMEYEISTEALAELKARLEGDEVPLTRQVTTKPLRLATPTPHVAAPSIDDEPNEAAPTASDEALEPMQVANAVPAIAIPASTRERLPVPTTAQADSVIADSVRFEEGTLRALTPGKARSAAQERLKSKWEDKFEDNQRPLPDRARGRGE